jgi:hypothetical protein
VQQQQEEQEEEGEGLERPELGDAQSPEDA